MSTLFCNYQKCKFKCILCFLLPCCGFLKLLVSLQPAWIVSEKSEWLGSNSYSMRFTRWILWVQYLLETDEILKQTEQSVARREDLG